MFAVRHRKWFLLALATLGAAGMFLGPDRWLGVDLGLAGSAVFYTAFWLFVMLLSRHPEAIFPADSGLAERRAWIGGVFVALIAIHFVDFLIALTTLGAAADEISNPASRVFSFHLGMVIFGWIIVDGVVRSRTVEPVELDERDLRVHHSAGRMADGLLTVQIVTLVAALALAPQVFETWMRPLIVANLLLGLLIARTLAENAYTVVRYWRDRA